MKEALSSSFWNQEVASTRSIDASICQVPAEPFPFSTQLVSGLNRSQQLLLFQRLFSVPFIPSFCADNSNNNGWVFDRALADLKFHNWWTTVTGRVKAGRLWAKRNDYRSNRDNTNESARTFFKSWMIPFQDSSNYAILGKSRFYFRPDTYLTALAELDSLPEVSGPIKMDCSNWNNLPWKGKLSFIHKMKKHQLSSEAAVNQILVDRNAQYWKTPWAYSLDLSNRKPTKGVRYRMGLYSTSGAEQEKELINEAETRPIPVGTFGGTRFQAAITAERSLCFWKGKSKNVKKSTQNLVTSKPRLTLTGLCGCFMSANLNNLRKFGHFSRNNEEKFFSGDLFGSFAASAQLGHFQKVAFDHTVLSARLDVGAASAFIKSLGHKLEQNSVLSQNCPSVALSFQQQVIGPVRVRAEGRFGVDLDSNKWSKLLDDVYAVDVAIGKAAAARFVLWYSPSRREGMAEVRLLDR